ncbi:hypothetical protein ANCCEY_06159 [Ancylostoma ceylanicum]|uniref:SGNH hydrolase-type esterase domain-containing protein n=1 Tax=Ancylostoma ceylanicum TaxID=53326 RepID=A0A0D6LS61_9BILA|nr:hypothetical protein ANCCEY_06159 [Ancylostoma ceylanicum]
MDGMPPPSYIRILYMHSPFVATVPIEVHPLSSTLDLHNNRLINSLTDFEQFYGVVTVTACNFSASANVTYRWQLFHEGSRMHAFQTNTCHTTVHCIKDLFVSHVNGNENEIIAQFCRRSRIFHGMPTWAGSYTIQLSVIGRHGELLRVGSRTFESRPLWMAIIGDSFASGEGNPDIQRKGYANAQWINERCHRSGKSFAAQVFAEIQKVKPQSYLTYLACAGATVENGILKAKGRISQLEALESVATMRGRGPDVVIITVGGNDIGFSDIINALAHDSSRMDISLMDMRFFFVSHQLDTVAERLKLLGAGNVFIPQYFDFTKNQYGEVDASCIASREENTGAIPAFGSSLLKTV